MKVPSAIVLTCKLKLVPVCVKPVWFVPLNSKVTTSIAPASVIVRLKFCMMLGVNELFAGEDGGSLYVTSSFTGATETLQHVLVNWDGINKNVTVYINGTLVDFDDVAGGGGGTTCSEYFIGGFDF